MRQKAVILLPVGNPMAYSNSADWISGDVMSCFGPIFSSRMRISAIFILPAEVLVTDSESQTPVPFSIHL